MKAAEFDRKFDEGESVLESFDLALAGRAGRTWNREG